MAELYQRRRDEPRAVPVDEDNPLLTEVLRTTEDQCIAYEQITVSSASIGLTPAKLALDADFAVADLETDQIRYRLDGVAPTSSVGSPVNVGTRITISGTHDLVAFRAIRVTTDAKLNVHYYQTVARAV